MTYNEFLIDRGCQYNKELKHNIYANANTAKELIVLATLLDTYENMNPEKVFNSQCSWLFSEFNELIGAESDTDIYFKQYCEYLLTQSHNPLFADAKKNKLLLEVYHKYNLMLDDYYVEYKNVINRLLLCVSKMLGGCNLKLK